MKFYLLLATAFITFFGCGSTSNSTNDAMDNNFTILKGTVPGTLIESFCDDGSYYATKSEQNGSAQHPFEIIIPKNLNCRLVMSTNEDNISTKVITPIRIVTVEGNNTVFQGVSDLVDVGYIDLALDRNDIVDANGDGVSDVNLELYSLGGGLRVVVLLNDPLDSDGDGIINLYEDDDGDQINNHDDDDDDNDGIKDIEDLDDNNDGQNDNDSDGDGIKDNDDIDDDNNGMKDEDEAHESSESQESQNTSETEDSDGASSQAQDDHSSSESESLESSESQSSKETEEAGDHESSESSESQSSEDIEEPEDEDPILPELKQSRK